LDIKNNAERVSVPVNKEVFLSEDFKKLWDSIKYHTHYSFQFDSDVLISNCIQSINENVLNRTIKYLVQIGLVNIDEAGVSADENTFRDYQDTSTYTAKSIPDVITYLQNETSLTRKTIVAILKGVHPNRIQYLKS